QQNAAMGEETSAATHRLSAEAGGLVRLISRFKLSDDAPAPAALVRNEPHRPVDCSVAAVAIEWIWSLMAMTRVPISASASPVAWTSLTPTCTSL
ncbi:hypothetical protein, partial [Rhizobium leguminosarum]|uniref:hypothetical protein n=1 Tax=Rhizobium leguminosarum TaxID=384 RepID=UPI003F974678